MGCVLDSATCYTLPKEQVLVGGLRLTSVKRKDTLLLCTVHSTVSITRPMQRSPTRNLDMGCLSSKRNSGNRMSRIKGGGALQVTPPNVSSSSSIGSHAQACIQHTVSPTYREVINKRRMHDGCLVHPVLQDVGHKFLVLLGPLMEVFLRCCAGHGAQLCGGLPDLLVHNKRRQRGMPVGNRGGGGSTSSNDSAQCCLAC